MAHSNTSSGHMFKNSVGRKEKLRFLKHIAPNLCPPGPWVHEVLSPFQCRFSCASILFWRVGGLVVVPASLAAGQSANLSNQQIDMMIFLFTDLGPMTLISELRVQTRGHLSL